MTHESKHTPAPWKVVGDEEETYVFFTAKNGKDYQLAQVSAGEGFNRKENARLIAAAPELLEALQGLMLWVMDEAIEAKKGGRKIGAYEAGRAALAKARGK